MITQELTEKFMNDELDDRLYYFTQKMSQDNVEIGHSFAFNMVRADDGEYLDWFLIHEVLAPVPDYTEWKQTEEQIQNLQRMVEQECSKRCELEQQLKEANDVLKQIADTRNFQHGHKFAQSYIKKWGIK